jgi:hypothetical protein
MNGWWHPRQVSGGEELSPRLPSLVSAWASVTKFEIIRRAWAGHALLFTTPISCEGGEIARWDIYPLTQTVGVRAGKDATLGPERSGPREVTSWPLLSGGGASWVFRLFRRALAWAVEAREAFASAGAPLCRGPVMPVVCSCACGLADARVAASGTAFSAALALFYG